jgi:hypothetical protein
MAKKQVGSLFLQSAVEVCFCLVGGRREREGEKERENIIQKSVKINSK